MIAFPHAKINLGLRVHDKRADGFHNLETVFYPVTWCDAIEVIQASSFSFELFGLPAGKEDDNLCVKAYWLLQQRYHLPAVKMSLLKNIPPGAGLGGGSSDASFTLKLLNDFFELDLSNEELLPLASSLGSDCAFFIEGHPSIAEGKGDELKPLQLDLSAYYISIVKPDIEINTSYAYRLLPEARSVAEQHTTVTSSLLSIIGQPVETWKGELINDFEEVIFPRHPGIADIKRQLYDQGALYASMSGSGSAVYGIFENNPEIRVGANRVFIGKL